MTGRDSITPPYKQINDLPLFLWILTNLTYPIGWYEPAKPITNKLLACHIRAILQRAIDKEQHQHWVNLISDPETKMATRRSRSSARLQRSASSVSAPTQIFKRLLSFRRSKSNGSVHNNINNNNSNNSSGSENNNVQIIKSISDLQEVLKQSKLDGGLLFNCLNVGESWKNVGRCWSYNLWGL